ncbi:LysR family transcriptional regulator [Nocardia sp. NPDC101769]|uniref:LysR family transcriptional regulator n=1 Tax=Nocardia sp. NPDC101769 TaxID=3364333 RepID=UPI00381B887B
MELRDIEIFLTLAEELHFGRTAQRLHVSVARVSQAIKKQERSVGADLFERTSRNVCLTPVGESLRDELGPHYRGLRLSLARARLKAQDKTDELRIGMLAANAYELRAFWDTFRARHPQWGLSIKHNGFADPFGPLRNGDIDALVWWLPIEEPDLTIGPIVFTEPRMLAVSVDHELAEEKSVSIEVLGNYPNPTVGANLLPEYSEDEFVPFYTPLGRKVEKPLVVLEAASLFGAIGQGQIIHSVGAHAERFFARPDVLYLPITDRRHLHWTLTWRSDTDNPLLRALVTVIRELGPAAL